MPEIAKIAETVCLQNCDCKKTGRLLERPASSDSAPRSRLVRIDQKLLAGGALAVDGDVVELQRFLQRHHFGVVAGEGRLEFGAHARAKLRAVGRSDLHQERE